MNELWQREKLQMNQERYLLVKRELVKLPISIHQRVRRLVNTEDKDVSQRYNL